MAKILFLELPATKSKRFDGFVRPHALALYKFAYRLLGNRADAEDLVQDVLLKLYPRTNEMAQVRDLKPWLLRVVYHQFIDTLRKRRRSVTTVLQMNELELVDPVQDPEHQLGLTQTSERVRVALGRLNNDQQLLVSLHLIDGYTLEEVAQVLDVPLGTLKSRLHRTRAELKKILQLEPFATNERVNGHELH